MSYLWVNDLRVYVMFIKDKEALVNYSLEEYRLCGEKSVYLKERAVK
jgi:hypothetical protein